MRSPSVAAVRPLRPLPPVRPAAPDAFVVGTVASVYRTPVRQSMPFGGHSQRLPLVGPLRTNDIRTVPRRFRHGAVRLRPVRGAFANSRLCSRRQRFVGANDAVAVAVVVGQRLCRRFGHAENSQLIWERIGIGFSLIPMLINGSKVSAKGFGDRPFLLLLLLANIASRRFCWAVDYTVPFNREVKRS